MRGRLQHQVRMAELGDKHAAEWLADQVVMAEKAAVAVPLLATLQLDQRALLVFGHQEDTIALVRDRLGVQGCRLVRGFGYQVGRG